MFTAAIAAVTSLLSGGTAGMIERVASEYIETNQEKSEAKAVLVKTMDPNGKMRRDLSRFASRAYGFYLVMTVILIFMSVWGVGGEVCSEIVRNAQVTTVDCVSRADMAADRMTSLFLPITASWASIVAASFGVNTMNSYKGRA
jgi:hypothetical protein